MVDVIAKAEPAQPPAQEKAVVGREAMLPAQLEGDPLTAEETKALSIFSTEHFGNVGKMPNFNVNLASATLRRFRKDEVICRQGDTEAFTAFYILSTEDVLKLRRAQLKSVDETLAAKRTAPRKVGGAGGETGTVEGHQFFRKLDIPELERKKAEMEGEVRDLEELQVRIDEFERQQKEAEERAAQRKAASAVNKPAVPDVKFSRGFLARFQAKGLFKSKKPKKRIDPAAIEAALADAKNPRSAATVILTGGAVADSSQRGSFARVWDRLRGRGADDDEPPDLIPIDAPVDLKRVTGFQARLKEKELFGEMSCLNRSPRSATVIARRDCYVLEMLRRVLDMLNMDPKFKETIRENYRRRVMEGHVRRLSIFEDLTDDQYNEMKDSVQLEEFPAGAVLIEEHAPSDAVYVIRSGMVKILANAGYTLRIEEITGGRDWVDAKKVLESPEAGAEAKAADNKSKVRAEKSKIVAEQMATLVNELAATANATDPLAASLWQSLPRNEQLSLAPLYFFTRTLGQVAASRGTLATDIKKAADSVGAARKDLEKEKTSAAKAQSEANPAGDATDDAQAKVAEKVKAAEVKVKAAEAKLKAAPVKALDSVALLKSLSAFVPEVEWVRDQVKQAKQKEGDAADSLAGALNDLVENAKRFSQDFKKRVPEALAGSTSVDAVSGELDKEWGPIAREFVDGARKLEEDARRLGRAAPHWPLDESGWLRLVDNVNALIQKGNGIVADLVKQNSKLNKFKTQLLRFIQDAQVVAALAGFAEDVESWSEYEGRLFVRYMLEQACPNGMPRRLTSAGPARVIAYRGRGDVIGEIGVLRDVPRTATCVAYDHPTGYHLRIPDSRTGGVPSRVEVLKIDRVVFKKLIDQNEDLRERLDELIRGYEAAKQAASNRQATALPPPAALGEFERLGLVQGQKLMLIDLDRCTRCGACVEACINAHTDGFSRLFLDGPRIENYLVPLTCRKCLDPVCMIGCPVGSIHRGDNGEIRIRNWCIGCSVCADQCPYGSITMNRIEAAELTKEQKEAVPLGVKLKEVTERAVVCDLCSSHSSRDPSCVYACPHDAAFRVDGQEFFLQDRFSARAAGSK